jgi:general secretion pathway protein L
MGALLRQVGVRLREITTGFFGWWLGELAALIPSVVRRSFSRRKTALVLDFIENEVVITQHSSDASREIIRLDLLGADADARRMAVGGLELAHEPGRTEVVLRLPIDQALRKTLELPMSAESNLHQLLFLELDRQTPYKPDQVYFDYWIRDRQPERGQMRVDLIVVPRAVVDQAVEHATRWGLAPTCVDVATRDSEDGPHVNLLPDHGTEPPTSPKMTLSLALAVLAMVLFVAAILIPLNRQQEAADIFERRIADAKLQAAETTRLRDEIERLAEEGRFLADKKKQSPLAVEILDELTRLVPDDSWLSEVHIKGAEVRVLGYSPAASTLIGLIEGSPLFRGVRFRSSVTQVRGSNEERFDLSFEVASGRAG